VVTIVKKNKVRLLTKTLAVVSLLAPASGHPLGIGEIKLHSALNQNLDAEISLTLSGESVADIKVNLAPPEKFDEAGVSWTYFLSKIKFETITQSNGSAIIKLTSKEALKEPFLDFLLEVSWPKGNLYREFTVLVDPPSVYNQATIPVSTSTESYAQSPAAAPLSHANGQTSEGEYGPTLENDTLWSVAERLRGQTGASVEQMMMAIYEANPQAFYKGNVYALTAGKTLKIPEKEAVLKLSRNQALAEFNRHTKAWKNHSAPANAEIAKAKEKPAPGKVEEAVDNQLTLVAPTKATVADHAVVSSANEQVGAGKKAISGETDGSIQSRITELEKQLAMMQELIALKDQQLAALQNQSQTAPAAQEQAVSEEAAAVKPVEQAIPAPPQAAAQPAESAQPVPNEVVPAKSTDQVAPAAPAEQPVPSNAAIVKPAEPLAPAPQPAIVKPVQPLAQPVSEADSLPDPYYLGAGGVGVAVLTLLGWFWWRKRKVEEETNTESMFASSSMIEAANKGDENISAPVVEDTAVHDHDTGTVGESSFLSEFTPSDFDSFDTDQGEIDPISEADVYLAYGRYQQAEELIRQAIKDQPNRDECKLKLLEIFYANENTAAFEAYANELAEAGKRNEAEFWEKAAEMGREICPDSPLFSSADDLFAVTDDENQYESIVRDDVSKESINAGAASFGESDSEDFDRKINESIDSAQEVDSIPAEDSSFVGEARNNEDIDFDLSSFSADTKESDEAERGVIASSTQVNSSPEALLESVDFDLSSFSADTKEPDEAEREDIDFDLSSFSMDIADSDGADNDLTATGALLDVSTGAADEVDKKHEFESYEFDFSSANTETKEIDDLDFSALGNDDKNHQDIDFSSDNALNFNDDLNGDFDFNFDLDMPLTTGRDSNQDDEFGVSDLTDMDELETKLDLAKAYVDMGDAEAAKELAKEVLEQGTPEQKKVAQTLLDELN
jgi:pilus assembly protein FimV